MTQRTRSGDWMQTHTGIAFWPLDPEPSEIDPRDIAHALSMLCRFGGHVKRFYSVAEHCVLMSRVVSPENALWALLHDATEAYLVDLPRPVKRMMPEYVAAEDNLMDFICYRFGLDPVFPREVKDADNRILITERNALMAKPSPYAWTGLEDLEPLKVEIAGLMPAIAEYMYRERLAELTGA